MARVLSLLEQAGLHSSETLTQTEALKVFQLEVNQIRYLDHEEAENPHSPSYACMQLYNAAVVARRALEVHGQDAWAKIQKLREEQELKEARRQQLKMDMARRSAEKARQVVARTPSERLCKQLSIDPQSKLTKTEAMRKFNLDWKQINGVPHEEKENPRNPRFKKMHLYRAVDVAQRALDRHTMTLTHSAA